jgi:hypothetical protein
MAVAAAIVAALYFVLYHGLLKPRCHTHIIQGARQPPTIVQGKRFLYEYILIKFLLHLTYDVMTDFASCHKRS